MTLKDTMGTRPLQMLMSKVNLSGKTRIVSEITNNMTAIMSWVRRKNRGAVVVFKTHLLLYSRVSRERDFTQKCAHAMTI
jgi:hypothetical protein